VCTDRGPVRGADIAYTADDDGDGGATPGWFGIMFLGHTTDPTGLTAPFGVGLSTYAHFSGRQPFSLGGDPSNDFERYEILAQGSIDSDGTEARDYRMLVSVGPFRELAPDNTLVVQLAFVAGEGEEGLLTNAVAAQIAFKGSWFDADGDPTTGVEGRETAFIGPVEGEVMEDECRKNTLTEKGCDSERLDERFNNGVRHIEEGDTVWSNVDCFWECISKGMCHYEEAESLTFRTGVDGRETNVHWTLKSALPTPRMRVDDHGVDGPVIYWDSRGEVTADGPPSPRFEGYIVWRADDWARPLGTSVATGPPTELWSALFQSDVINFFGDDTGLQHLYYKPLVGLLSPTEREDMLDAMVDYLMSSPEEDPPCPPGVSEAVCDTLMAVARWELGLRGGRQYYRYTDASVHLGARYFYAVTTLDHEFDDRGKFILGSTGDPASNFRYVEPKSATQTPTGYDENQIYVVPNPVTKQSLAAWALGPTNDDPTGVKVEFRNLPPSRGVIRVYTIAGDLIIELPFDGTTGVGSVAWDMVTRNGQTIASGVYLYSIEFEDSRYQRVIKKFTVIQ
jgi:hypothetical protein